jgi:Zn ribbon nucleic-acid-binding protein
MNFMWQENLVEVAKCVMDCFDVIAADVGDVRTSKQP